MSERIYSLDLLRGILAMGIMYFHLNNWMFGHAPATHPICLVGIYGVPAFYVLSGIALSYVYHGKIITRKQLLQYGLNRFLRIFPLLTLTTVVTIFLFPHKHNLTEITLNLTGLFSLLDPAGYIAIGAWSIGNELVFYMVFPALLLLLAKSQPIILGVSMAMVVSFFGLGFLLFEHGKDFKLQWPTYIHYLNQFFFFYSGVITYYLKQSGIIKNKYAYLFIASGLICLLGPDVKVLSDLISGPNRMLFSLGTIAIVSGFFLLKDFSNNWIKSISTFLGKISFAVYLMHPPVYHLAIKFFAFTNRDVYYQNKPVIFFTLLAVTITLATITTRYFMEPIYLLRKRIP